MSIRDQVRQLLVVSFSGTAAPVEMLKRRRPGGVIYFEDNLTSYRQTRALSRRMQRVSRRVGLPLLVATDQEGGLVTRLPGPISELPGGAELGGDADLGFRVARRTGEAMVRMGVNLNFAPVADVNTVGDAGVIGDRAFSSRTPVVERMVRAQVCGYHAGGVAATVKHFPGHGSTRVDSHETLPTLSLTRRQWRTRHRPPFVVGQHAEVDAVMVGHLAFPRLDPTGDPATLSPVLTRHWLRERLGYAGVVVTDALNMAAVADGTPPGTVAVQAFRAGADLLLMPPDHREAVRALTAAVADGRVPKPRLAASVERVLRLKQRLGLLGDHPDLPRC